MIPSDAAAAAAAAAFGGDGGDGTAWGGPHLGIAASSSMWDVDEPAYERSGVLVVLVGVEVGVDRGEERWCTHVMHGRSRMTLDPRIPTMPGWNGARGVFTDQADIASAKSEAPWGVWRVA